MIWGIEGVDGGDGGDGVDGGDGGDGVDGRKHSRGGSVILLSVNVSLHTLKPSQYPLISLVQARFLVPKNS